MKTQLQGKVVCVALNDKQQLEQMQATFEQAPYKALPTEPVLYFKPHNTWNEFNAPIAWQEEGLVVGASLALIIGKTCCRVSAEQALDYVDGCAILHDFSLPEASYYRPDIKGKCLDGSATIGEMASVSDLGELSAQTITVSVNDTDVVDFPLARLERSAEQLVEKVSRIMTLEKGDILAIGFAGDRVEIKQGDTVTSRVGQVLSLKDSVGEAK